MLKSVRLALVTLVLATGVCLGDSPAGQIGAAPAQVVIAPGALGATTITWSTSGCGTAQVRVALDGGAPALMAEAPAGSAVAPWIQAGHGYELSLTAERDARQLLGRTLVLGVPSGGGVVVATPASVPIAPGGLGTTTISWATDGAPAAEIRVRGQQGMPDQLFARGASGMQEAPWIQTGVSVDFDVYAGAGASTLLSTVHVVGVAGSPSASPSPSPSPSPPSSYRVGVDYHSTTFDFGSSAFLQTYDDPSVRAVVRAQLQGMADRGASFVSTRLWLVSASPTADQHWEWHFPPSPQELANLRTFAQDVAMVQAADGHGMTLDLCTLWLWAAEYEVGSPATTLGHENLTAAEFTSRVSATVDSILGEVKDVRRPDGRQVVETFYFDGEVMVGAKPNQEWFLATHYPSFVSKVAATGITPSLYFLVVADESEVLDDGFTDGSYPDLDGHRSMYWVYRSLRFMKDAGLPLPARMDASVYVEPKGASYDDLVKRIFDDGDAALGPLGMASRYGVAETHYYEDASRRKGLGKALAREATTHGRLERTSFWTTPDAGDPGVSSGYPFAIEDYLP